MALFTAGYSDLDTDSTTNRSEARAHKSWSVFVYVDADNNLEKFAIEDVNEMEKVGSTDDVNIVVQVDRVPGYDKSNGDWTDTRRFYITKDNDTELINSEQLGESLGEKNMADPGTLQDFLEWGITNYPADHYLVVMWDHGRGIFRSSGGGSGGIFRGFNEDLTSNTQEMKLWELDEILKNVKLVNSGRNLDIVAFDQCWLGNVETAYELMDSVDFLIASADEEPDKGWNYYPPLSRLVVEPDMTPREFAIHITNDYVEEYANKTSYDYMTQVTVDLQELNTTFLPLMEKFSEALIDNFYTHQETLFEIRGMLDNYYFPHPDLYHFIQLVASNMSLPADLRANAQALMGNYSKIILAEGHGNAHPVAYGLAVYFPDSLKYSPYTNWQAEYDTHIDYSKEKWSEFLHMFHNPVSIQHRQLKDTEDTINPYEVSAVVNGYRLDTGKVWLHYSRNGTQFISLNMSHETESNSYTAEIPVQPKNTDVYYYLEAKDSLGNRIYQPENAPVQALKDLNHFFVGKDVTPPVIGHSALSDKIYSKDDFEITVTVTDNIEVDPSNVKLHYRINNEKNSIELTMSPLPNDPARFRAFIPSQLIGTTVSYHFSATDEAESPNTVRLPVLGEFQFRILGIILNIGRDIHHGKESSDYNEFFEHLQAPGYNLTEINQRYSQSMLYDIETEDLEFDMVVITEPDMEYTATEISSIKEYLSIGGRLLIVAGDDPGIMNGLTDFLGITWSPLEDGDGYSGSFADVPAIFNNVFELYYSEPGLGLDVKYPATELVEDDLGTSILAAYSYYGQGKVLAISSGFFQNDVIGYSNNIQFLNNIGLWLVKSPVAIPLGPKTMINGEPFSGIKNLTLTIWEDDYIGFDGNSSVNPEYQTTDLNYTWNFGNGLYTYIPRPAYRFTDSGDYDVELIVKTYDGFTDIKKVNIRVSNHEPQAYPGYTNIVGLTVYFNGSASFDSPSDRNSLSYFWDFGDGETATGCDPVHSYRSKDVYYVSLTVTDDDGATSIVTLKVDLGGKDEATFATYLPAIGAVVILIIILVLYFMMMRKKKPKVEKSERIIEERVPEAIARRRAAVRRQGPGVRQQVRVVRRRGPPTTFPKR